MWLNFLSILCNTKLGGWFVFCLFLRICLLPLYQYLSCFPRQPHNLSSVLQMDFKQGVLSLSYFWLSLPITPAIFPPPTEIQPPENEMHFGNVWFIPNKGWTTLLSICLSSLCSYSQRIFLVFLKILESLKIKWMKASPMWNLVIRGAWRLPTGRLLNAMVWKYFLWAPQMPLNFTDRHNVAIWILGTWSKEQSTYHLQYINLGRFQYGWS